MMGRSHMLTGTLTAAAASLALHLDAATTVGVIAVTTASALLPDMDYAVWDRETRRMKYSTITSRLGLPGKLVAIALSRTVGHRTLTHSFLGLVALGIGLAFVPWPVWVTWAILLGCAVHIFGDMCTQSGVPLFWPRKRCYQIGRLQTGGFVETYLVYPLLCVLTAAAVGSVIALGARA